MDGDAGRVRHPTVSNGAVAHILVHNARSVGGFAVTRSVDVGVRDVHAARMPDEDTPILTPCHCDVYEVTVPGIEHPNSPVPVRERYIVDGDVGKCRTRIDDDSGRPKRVLATERVPTAQEVDVIRSNPDEPLVVGCLSEIFGDDVRSGTVDVVRKCTAIVDLGRAIERGCLCELNCVCLRICQCARGEPLGKDQQKDDQKTACCNGCECVFPR